MKRLFFAVLLLFPNVAFASGKGFLWVHKLPFWENISAYDNHSSSPPLLDPSHISSTHLVHSIFAAFFLILLAWLGTRKIRRGKADVVPDEKLTLRNLWELAVGALYSLIENILGEEDARQYFPFLGSLFIYILVCNLMGLLPGFLPPTSNVSINAGMAILVFLYYNYSGFKRHGVGYLRHFLGPMIYLAPLIFTIELISHIVRPVSLSVRLYGNIYGDHTVIEIFTDLIPYLIPMIFYLLGLFVCFIQALVFTLLSTVYFQLSLAHEH